MLPSIISTFADKVSVKNSKNFKIDKLARNFIVD